MDENRAHIILGVNNYNTKNEIKKIYKKLALKHHPDKNSGNEGN
uniref:J domain-containing protein n=1 Tax=viral metagenome TaxID=1070528 RepID=A0A6C0AE98_9ZZZZ